MFENFTKSKTFYCSINLMVGFIVGYITVYYQICLNILDKILNFMHEMGNMISPIFSFTPKPDFLSDVAAFEAVIIGLAVPLSLEIVSRISERYQSEVISKQFIQEWEIKWLPKFLIINIILAIVLRFFVTSEQSSINWKILAWMTLIIFIVIAIIFVKFIKKLENYITDTEFILERLYDDAEELFK